MAELLHMDYDTLAFEISDSERRWNVLETPPTAKSEVSPTASESHQDEDSSVTAAPPAPDSQPGRRSVPMTYEDTSDDPNEYPACQQWWNDGSNGLRAKLLKQVDPSLLNRLAGWAGFLSRTEVDDSVIRAIAAPRQQKINQGAVYTDYGGQIDKTIPNIITRGAGDVGMAVGALAAFPAMDVMRQPSPADDAGAAQDGLGHLYPAGTGHWHLRPENRRHRQRGAVRAVLRRFLVPTGALDRQHHPQCPVRLGLRLESPAYQL